MAETVWKPIGPQRVCAARLYEAPDGCSSVLYEDVEITDEMVERAARAIVNYDCKVHAAPQLRKDQPLDDVNNPDAYRDRARVALRAAFNQGERHEP